jgi:methylaspartate ammonia-lyase
MSHLPTITNALVMPGVSAVRSELSLLVGLVIDDRRIAWGECTFAADSEQDGRLNESIHILQEIIIPALMGQPLGNVIALMEQIDQMRHDVTVVRPITAETPPPKRSRRELFTSLINPEQEIREVVERPLPPELRQGISQALFSAAALVEDSTIVEAVARIYSLQPAESPLPIHLIFDDLPNPDDPALAQITAASYGLTINDDDPVKELGSGGVRLQNRVRQLKNRVVRYLNNDYPAQQTTGFLFDLKGGYGMLYEQNTGHILGALNGLEQVVKPYPLRLVDPVIMDDRAGQMAIMKELQNFIRLRKMKTGLIARSWIETAEDIHALANNDCCGGVLLDMTQLGTLHHTVELALAAQERNLEVILTGVQGVAAVHTALALNPTLLAIKVGAVSAVSDEINRTLAWLAYSG